MICPHCSADLLAKQRYRNRCSRCRREFALDPKHNPVHLHDLRVRKLAELLRDPLQPGAAPLRYTADQLRLAACRKILADPSEKSEWTGCGCAVGFMGAFLAFGALIIQQAGLFFAVVGIVGVVLVICLIGHVATARQRRLPGEPITAAAFARLLARWEEVYREPPPGLIHPGPVSDLWPSTPPVALVYCADAGTVQFLAAAGIVERRGVALINSSESLRPAVGADPALPVLVLHHADPAGCLAVPRLRAVLPPATQVIDAGLRPRVAARADAPVRTPPDQDMLDELERVRSVEGYERSWLAEGNTVPLAAVRPARLLMAVERAISRVDTAEDRAAGLGFMAWPERAG